MGGDNTHLSAGVAADAEHLTGPRLLHEGRVDVKGLMALAVMEACSSNSAGVDGRRGSQRVATATWTGWREVCLRGCVTHQHDAVNWLEVLVPIRMLMGRQLLWSFVRRGSRVRAAEPKNQGEVELATSVCSLAHYLLPTSLLGIIR